MQLQTYLSDVPDQVGVAYTNERLGRISSTFAYNPGYLANIRSYQIDPELPLQLGNWPVVGNGLPNCMRDSAPDRWGRNLIKKKYPDRSLNDLDYLLEVSDASRQGALRFKVNDADEFLSTDTKIPKLMHLGELLDASRDMGSIRREDAAVKYLLDAGTASLGGARPKAILRINGELWVAKFEHASDEYDVILEEYKALRGAATKGISIPEIMLKRVGNSNVLLLKRFDREIVGDEYQRIGYISAMTALGA
jgi:serine/threonine-protein kinase HipA